MNHLYNQSPVGIWNQLNIALITVTLMEIYRLMTDPQVSAASFFRNIHFYLLQTWGDAQKEFERLPQFTIKGRKSNHRYPKKAWDYGEDHSVVSPLNKSIGK